MGSRPLCTGASVGPALPVLLSGLLHRVLRCEGDELEAEARITPEQLFMDTLGAVTPVGGDAHGFLGVAFFYRQRLADAFHQAGFTGSPGEAFAGGTRNGDPSPSTAYGVFIGIQTAVKHRLGRDDLHGLKVAIQGVGQVGFDLARQLKAAGAELWVTDIVEANVRRAVEQLGATAVTQQAIFGLDVDVFAPCAMGGIINQQTLEALRAPIIAGAANNQLADASLAETLRRNECLYAPDYAINAGGIIDVYYGRSGGSAAQLKAHIEGIGATLEQIFQRADAASKTTVEIADQLAEERFGR